MTEAHGARRQTGPTPALAAASVRCKFAIHSTILGGSGRMTVTSRGLYAFLTILTGNRAGTNFPLDARRQTLIGRGTDCHISVPDPLCSRVHATLTCTP